MSQRHRHLVGVWNPSYEADAMDAHIGVLLAHARRARANEIGEDDVYVWWGKLGSPHRQGALPHLDEVLALDTVLSSADQDAELHLYLTDYRSLYVAHLGAVTADDVRQVEGEREHIPSYYFQPHLSADCWFQLWDIRRLVLDDTPATIAELRLLRNTHHHDQPVSLYGGMTNLPLLVTRPDGARFFDPELRERLTDGRHWVEFDAERAGTGATQQDLRDNRFGPKLWANLDPAARTFIATAEQIYRTHRSDASVDLSVVIVDFSKAMEVQVRSLLRQALASAEERIRRFTFDGRSYDITGPGHFSLGALARAISEDPAKGTMLRRRLVHGDWFVASLPAILEELRVARNPAAHGGTLPREEIARLRNQLIGVGCAGSLVELARVRLRG